jgi:hypothetical protein
MLWCCEHHNPCNLQAGEPLRRPFNSSTAASNVAPSPSGAVPDDGADGRSVELIFFFGGEGPDCILESLVGVLVVKVEDIVVFCYFLEVLFVTCKPTD